MIGFCKKTFRIRSSGMAQERECLSLWQVATKLTNENTSRRAAEGDYLIHIKNSFAWD